jgi:hypothetical protein
LKFFAARTIPALFLYCFSINRIMNRKERKGGELSNKEVEEELQRQGVDRDGAGYRGSQDTGDEVVRQKGTTTQQEDGAGNATNDA